MVELKKQLRRLCKLPGPPGYEDAVRNALTSDWEALVDHWEIGKLGSLVGYKYGKGLKSPPQIMLMAHMDEIALIVKSVDQGFLRVAALGLVDNRLLAGKSVVVCGSRALPGVIGVAPLYTVSSDLRSVYPRMSDLFVDVGLPESEVNELVSIGDPIIMDNPVIELLGDRIVGKAMDNRASLAAITVCLDHLQSRSHTCDLLIVGSVQEEIASAGAITEVYRLHPDAAIVIDVGFAMQPGVIDGSFALGEGPALSFGANFHPALFEAIKAVASKTGIPLHVELLPENSGTEASYIQISGSGIPCALVNIPVRNMHSPNEMVDTKDIERVGRLLAEFIVTVDKTFINTLMR